MNVLVNKAFIIFYSFELKILELLIKLKRFINTNVWNIIVSRTNLELGFPFFNLKGV